MADEALGSVSFGRGLVHPEGSNGLRLGFHHHISGPREAEYAQ